MSDSRRHHFVSKCYLKGFTSDGSANTQLFVIDARSGQTFSITPANAAVEHDFNAVEGHPPGELEDMLSRVESDIAPALERVINARSVENRDDWVLVLNLIALFAVRNPRWRKLVGDMVAKVTSKMMALSLERQEVWEAKVKQMRAAGHYKEGEPKTNYEQMKEFIKSRRHHVKVSRGWQIGMEFKTFEPVLNTMVERAWTLIVTDDQTGHFITTDHPVCLTHWDFTPRTFQRPLGHGTPGSRLFLPVNRHIMAVGTLGGQSGVAQASEYDVAVLNGIVGPLAYRHVFAPSPNFPVIVKGRKDPITGAELADFIASKHQDQQKN